MVSLGCGSTTEARGGRKPEKLARAFRCRSEARPCFRHGRAPRVSRFLGPNGGNRRSATIDPPTGLAAVHPAAGSRMSRHRAAKRTGGPRLVYLRESRHDQVVLNTQWSATSMDKSRGPVPNGIVLTQPSLHRATAAKLRACKDPDIAELAEAHEGAAQLLQERKDLRTAVPPRE